MPSFPSPSDIFNQYKTILKSLRPDINVDDPSLESVIRGKVLSGLIAGVYGDQKKVLDDTFVSDARTDSVLRKGAELGMSQQPATAAHCDTVPVTGTSGSTLTAGTVLQYASTGRQYTADSTYTFASTGTVNLPFTCTTVGQAGNVLPGNQLTFVSPPTGITASVTLSSALSNGTDRETVDSFRARILNRLQHFPAGGNQFDYPNFAFMADASVRSATIFRWVRGLGTVDIYISTGTTDIDTALNAGQSIVRIPTTSLISKVQTYYNQNAPMCDAPAVYAPIETAQAVTVNVVLAAGLTLSSVPTDATNNPLGLTVQQLIQREVSRVLYKIPVGGRKVPGLSGGWIVSSDIERQLDTALSAVLGTNGVSGGLIPVLMDRQVLPLSGGSANNVSVAQNSLVTPGAITVSIGVS